mmetsp:Transcript_2744/g.4077  ORF Transcript_2744/g.4077 Transcript_2744/m.4077 type:complete len:162 (+) Transcript_2744:401-886(+)
MKAFNLGFSQFCQTLLPPLQPSTPQPINEPACFFGTLHESELLHEVRCVLNIPLLKTSSKNALDELSLSLVASFNKPFEHVGFSYKSPLMPSFHKHAGLRFPIIKRLHIEKPIINCVCVCGGAIKLIQTSTGRCFPLSRFCLCHGRRSIPTNGQITKKISG